MKGRFSVKRWKPSRQTKFFHKKNCFEYHGQGLHMHSVEGAWSVLGEDRARCLKEFDYTLKIVRVILERSNPLWSYSEEIRNKYFPIALNLPATGTLPALRMKSYFVGCTVSCDGIVDFKISQRPYTTKIFKNINTYQPNAEQHVELTESGPTSITSAERMDLY
ncbi:hypothetical protein RF11_08888 [Thelohanellus kitauei]|uniref:Uncharacterized protein n=1 Tax=Thelohanellus kitauei TaxID=669202 RepID=A0A0C2MPP2_THEKT|nr:hypothetical protein RF11_08888 [Thelohanellus kitauei]